MELLSIDRGPVDALQAEFSTEASYPLWVHAYILGSDIDERLSACTDVSPQFIRRNISISKPPVVCVLHRISANVPEVFQRNRLAGETSLNARFW
jgi:hypothetical protein